MIELIKINKSKCTLCYACVRSCPVRAIYVNNDNNGISIHLNRCIGCGNCYVNCSTKAIEYHSSLSECSEALSTGMVMAIVDPAIAAEFPDITDYRNFVGMIRAIGFKYVCEISHGADLVAKEYKSQFEGFKGKYFITSACTPVVEYIRKFQPGLIENLLPIVSPMVATAIACQQVYGNDIKIIAITPCIGQKLEAEEFKKHLHSVLSFEELRELFNQKDINENSVEFSEFDPPYGSKGSLYPISIGLLEAADINTKSGINRIITRDGQDEFKDNIDDFSKIAAVKHHLNAFYCKGCCTGPCTTSNKSYLRSHSLVVDYTLKRLAVKNSNTNYDFSKIDITRLITADDQRIPMPEVLKVNEVLRMLGREKQDNHGCQSCGYKTCTDFAIDVAKGLMKPELCVTYTMRNSQEFIRQLTISNKKLAETQKALEVSEVKMRQEHNEVKETMNLLNAIMQKLPSGVVLADKNLKIIQSNERFIQLVGKEAIEINEIIPGLAGADLKTMIPQSVYNLFVFVINNNEQVINKDISYDEKLMNISVFPIKKGEIAGAVFRDLFQPEVRHEEVINRVNEVIEKNLQMVQQIGFLLGEGASETERMLNSIIESYQKDNKPQL